ncbi:hypothetical protein GCM10023318_45370 [Nocardia callitridis]|uniref:Uncharacterized protein n=1 Tax=Nocardia callitridis TaxID=648753 RepID=A0ABP9KN16_9NOCA
MLPPEVAAGRSALERLRRYAHRTDASVGAPGPVPGGLLGSMGRLRLPRDVAFWSHGHDVS